MERNVQTARAAQEKWDQNKAAAILRPIGTGKGQIAWKLIEDAAGENALWLTETEAKQKLRQAEMERLGGTLPQRVTFCSASQLEQASAAEWVALAERRPGILIIDGWREWSAVQWERCIEPLRRFCPSAKLLGLASPDQPDRCWTAEALFRENTVEAVSLEEAWAEGLLPQPKAVTPLLWPMELAQSTFQAQRKNLPLTGGADPSEKPFNAFSRAVEKAEPVEKLLADALPQGSYFVLCETEDAGARLKAERAALFGPAVNVTEMAEDWSSAAAKNFAARKAKGTALLIVQNGMAAEPVPGMAGAILVRATADAAAYRRMLATALMVCGKVPVVELNAAAEGMNYAKALRQDCEKTGGKSFPVEEPMQAVSRAARQLQRSLDAQWDQYYAAAKAAAADGDLNDLPRTRTADGSALGRWLELQRQVRAGDRPGRLTKEQAAQLEKLGLVWKQRLEQAWERGFLSAQNYRSTHPDLLVPVRYEDKNGFALGEWIVYNRQRYLSGNLSAERIERLQALGMVWDTAMTLWNQSYAAAVQFYLEHHTLEVPVKYVTPEGLALGVWLGSQRAAYKDKTLTPEQIAQLEALHIDWTNRNDRKWQAAYEAAVRYHAEHGDLNVPSEYIDPDGVLLGKWVSRQRYAWQNPGRSSARVTPERKALLDALGMVWEKADSWQDRYALAAAYKKEHGSLDVPASLKTEDGVSLSSWITRQRQLFRRDDKTLSPERRKALKELFRGEPERRNAASRRQRHTLREQNWLNNYRRAKVYAKRTGDLIVPASYVDETGFRLGVWISNLRAARKTRPDSFQVTPEHIRMLDDIGMEWDAREAKWQCAFRRAEEYRQTHDDLLVPVNYKAADGFCLGDWIRRMRESYALHDAKLTPERAARLESLGMVWEVPGV